MSHDQRIFNISNIIVDCSNYNPFQNAEDPFINTNLRSITHDSSCAKTYLFRYQMSLFHKDLTLFVSNYKYHYDTSQNQDHDLYALILALQTKNTELNQLYDQHCFNKETLSELYVLLVALKDYAENNKEEYLDSFNIRYNQAQDMVLSSIFGITVFCATSFFKANYLNLNILGAISVSIASLFYQAKEAYHQPQRFLDNLEASNLKMSENLLKLEGEILNTSE